jgi:hypothetical protein
MSLFKLVLPITSYILPILHTEMGIKNGLEKILAILGMDPAAYHGGDLHGKNVQEMFQKSDSIFLQFQELPLGVDEEDG